MAQRVRVQAAETKPRRRLCENGSLEHLGAQCAALDSREGGVARVAAGEVGGELIDQKSRNRDLAPLVALRRAPRLNAADEGHGLGDRRSPSHEVDAVNSQCGQFAEADSRVGEEQNDQAV